MRLQCHVFFLLLALTAAAAVVSRKEAYGPKSVWTPIKDLSDPHVEDIAQFAISAHNSRPFEPVIILKLQRIIKGETQVVAGTNYRLLLEACSLNGSPHPTGIYEAIVLERPEVLQSLSLTSFKLVHQS
ncbi:hypothetical protein PIB30_020261 [Stylosanthes scabra]|uniref:Cystatin domain-containing protein n=1 Tax=Stylosanthes scabra TaxID=79078 RepID=A0ABU6U8U8_9FABA|nr:hypothetical protein [Stylosanthes scabra]